MTIRVAYLIERHDGFIGYGNERQIVDALKYNPMKPSFWAKGAQEHHTVTPLCAAPVVSEQSAYKAAIATLEHLGYTYHGGEMWKPPLGPAPNFSLIDQLHAEIDALKEQLGSYPAQIVDSDKILSDMCDLFKIGEDARTRSAIMTNIENVNDFADKLHAIEREFFMVPGEPDDDYPDEEPADECLVNCWGTTTEQYVEQFRAALKSLSAQVAVPECFQRLLKHSHGMSMGVDWNNGTSAGFHREKLLEAVKDCRAAILNYSGGYTEMVNSPAIHAGWKLVPDELTIEMQHAWDSAPNANTEDEDANMRTAYRAMLSAVPQPPVSASGWIKCSDRMPEDDSYVVAAEIGHDGTIYAAVASWFLHNRFNLMEDGISASNYDGGACIDMNLSVTHWMPLPAAPKPEGE